MSQAHCCCYIFGPSACLLFHSTTHTLNLIKQPIKKEIRSISTRSNQLWLLKCSISFPSVTSALSRFSFLFVHSVGSLTPSLPGTIHRPLGGQKTSLQQVCCALFHVISPNYILPAELKNFWFCQVGVDGVASPNYTAGYLSSRGKIFGHYLVEELLSTILCQED